MNDRLRTVASANLAAAVARPAGRYVGESITFPYVDSGAEWIDESVERTYFWGNTSCVDAEAAASNVTNAGGHGVALRFAISLPLTSARNAAILATARRGILPIRGELDGFVSWIDIDDAAAAVVAGLGAPPRHLQRSRNPTRSGGPTMPVRSHHATGRRRLRPLPKPAVQRLLAGAGVGSVVRSQRISSASLMSVTKWEPTHRVVDGWS